MKNLSLFNKVMVVANFLLAIATILSYILPFLTPEHFPFLAVLTLGLPLIFFVNFLFFLFWLFQAKKHLLISGILLLIGITLIEKFYQFNNKPLPQEETDITLMSYNVRMFNLYNWVDISIVPELIREFINIEDPDILCIQEYSFKGDPLFKKYKYNYTFYKYQNKHLGQAIFSRFPIINKGNIQFENSNNLVIFADLLIQKDTVRVYSMHLQSLSISKDVDNFEDEELNKEKSKTIIKKISKGFLEQQKQVTILKEHVNACPYKVVVCGDMNNSAFSYVYKYLSSNLNDAFVESGSGLGKTYNFKYYPARIDYILADKSIVIKDFQTFQDLKASDHFPIKTRFNIK